jgi:hypothetical protein
MRSLLTLFFTSLVSAQTSFSATPHEQYSSSIGVLGCKIDTNRVAYWPMAVDCDNICVEVSYGGRSVNLLRIDQSGGAHDMSYDAWNYLTTGQSATVDPTSGGGVTMTYQDVPAANCASLIKTPGNKLPLTAANSMNYVASCLSQSSSWVANNYALYNIVDPICSMGYDEQCSLDLTVSNQPACPHTLGLQTPLTGDTVYNVQYGTGLLVSATTGQVASNAPPVTESTASDPVNAPAPVSAPVAAAVTAPLFEAERAVISRIMRRWRA